MSFGFKDLNHVEEGCRIWLHTSVFEYSWIFPTPFICTEFKSAMQTLGSSYLKWKQIKLLSLVIFWVVTLCRFLSKLFAS
jgi:hypothetical protein